MCHFCCPERKQSKVSAHYVEWEITLARANKTINMDLSSLKKVK